jgi:hypothetical protein
MINLQVNEVNTFAIYADTIDNSIQDWGDYFLLRFKSTYTNHYIYVLANVEKRNSSFVQLSIEVLQENEPDDPYNGVVTMFPPGNYSYQCYCISTPTLDPSTGILIDQAQAIVSAYEPPEINQVVYISDNDTFQNQIYYSGTLDSCIINYANSPYIVSIDLTKECDPLLIQTSGFLLIEKNKTLTITQPYHGRRTT